MSIIRAFYNQKAFPNILMVVIKDAVVDTSKTQNHICALYDKEGELLGYNIECEDYPYTKDGYQKTSKALLNYINEKLSTEGFPVLEHDFTPRIVVGHIKKCEEHPDSDHLHVCLVDVGARQVQIVCGASNVKEDQYVVVALDQAVLADGKLILKGKLRGIESEGMICSEWELGLIDHKEKGILVLDKTNYVGDDFFGKDENNV
ncbi:MAG: DUF4479 domain-containing protein [Erysipelotrichaceae bacterium]